MNDKKKETKDIRIQIRFTPSEFEEIKNRAESEGRTISNLVHYIVMDNLNE